MIDKERFQRLVGNSEIFKKKICRVCTFRIKMYYKQMNKSKATDMQGLVNHTQQQKVEDVMCVNCRRLYEEMQKNV